MKLVTPQKEKFWVDPSSNTTSYEMYTCKGGMGEGRECITKQQFATTTNAGKGHVGAQYLLQFILTNHNSSHIISSEHGVALHNTSQHYLLDTQQHNNSTLHDGIICNFSTSKHEAQKTQSPKP